MSKTPLEIRVPGDKSISHRALIFTALANGRSRIRDILLSADVHSTAGVLRALGVAVPPLGNDVTIDGRGARALMEPSVDLDCGNSGTTTRLMAGVAAGRDFRTRFIGDASLSRRPMRRVAKPLTAMGARVELESGDGLPMVIHGGALRSIRWTSETASAQIKSAILLAGVVGGVEVEVTEPSRSRNHTERMLRALGATVDVDVVPAGTRVRVSLVGELAPLDIVVPADPSSAAFFIALAVLTRSAPIVVPHVCLNPTRTGFFDALRSMGADVHLEEGAEQGGERTGRILGSHSSLRGLTVGGDQVPSMIDELPLLACVGARARGETIIAGAEELRVKESDRIATVVSNLRAIGATAEERPDGLIVEGSEKPLRGRVETRGDHRIAMAFGILGALPGNEIEIDDRDCVAVSYPGFWEDLARATRTFAAKS
ncbi:MAG: 3-phosphoshikimate 1-carboxyvinyltransferase [Gemmatimonadota bacterium]|nr:3-phosphoshikimate 1-carboxyvinyltransferase [Gemmatimonadota bacterium]